MGEVESIVETPIVHPVQVTYGTRFSVFACTTDTVRGRYGLTRWPYPFPDVQMRATVAEKVARDVAR